MAKETMPLLLHFIHFHLICTGMSGLMCAQLMNALKHRGFAFLSNTPVRLCVTVCIFRE